MPLVTKVYPDKENSPLVHWDGSNIESGSPAALQMAGSYTYLSDESFTDVSGRETTLDPPERAALALVGSGMAIDNTTKQLDAWFAGPSSGVETLLRKLGRPGRHSVGEHILACAHRKSLLLSESAPNLGVVRPARRQRLVDLATLLGTGRLRKDIAETLQVNYGTLRDNIFGLGKELGYDYVEQPGQLLAMFGIAADLTPRGVDDDTDLHTLLHTITDEENRRLFLPAKTKPLEWHPFNDDRSHISIRFTDQPFDAEAPDVHVGGIDQIQIAGASIEVNNMGLAPRELAAFVFRCVGMGWSEVAIHTATRYGARGGRTSMALTQVYNSLLPSRAGKGPRTYAAECAIRTAFDRGLYVSRRPSRLRRLPHEVRTDIMHVVDGRIHNKTIEATAKSVGRSAATLLRSFETARERLYLNGDKLPDQEPSPHRNIAVCFLAEADRQFYEAAA